MAKEIRTYKDVQDAIIRRAKIEDTTANRDSLKEKINTTYINIGYEEPYRWSGETYSIFLPKRYVTGSVTATNNDETLTGASTAWAENSHFGWKAKVGSVNFPYNIVRVASTTSIEMNAAFTGTTASTLAYTFYQDEIGLPPDLQDIRKFRIPGLSKSLQPIPTSPEEMDRMRDQAPFRTGIPRYYTIFGKKHYHQKTWASFAIDTDYWEEDFAKPPKAHSLVIYPGIRTADRYSIIRYTKILSPMVLDAEEPLMPVENRQILVWGVLVDHFLTNRDIPTQREWLGQFIDQKRRMSSDIETTDDELILIYDKTGVSRQPRYSEVDDALYATS